MQSPNPAYMANQSAWKANHQLLASLEQNLQALIPAATEKFPWPVPKKRSKKLPPEWHNSLLSSSQSVPRLLREIFPSGNVQCIWTYRLRRFGRGQIKVKFVQRGEELHCMYFELPPGLSYNPPDEERSISMSRRTTQPDFGQTSSLSGFTTTHQGRPYLPPNSTEHSQLSLSSFGGSRTSRQTPSALSSWLFGGAPRERTSHKTRWEA